MLCSFDFSLMFCCLTCLNNLPNSHPCIKLHCSKSLVMHSISMCICLYVCLSGSLFLFSILKLDAQKTTFLNLSFFLMNIFLMFYMTNNSNNNSNNINSNKNPCTVVCTSHFKHIWQKTIWAHKSRCMTPVHIYHISGSTTHTNKLLRQVSHPAKF